MKKILFGFTLIIISLGSCDNANKIADELSFLWDIRKEFGGQWVQSYENNCYKIEITNSDRINDNRDSIDHFGVIIGRKYIESVELNYSCLTLECLNESNYVVYSNSDGFVHNFDLSLIKKFMDLPIEEYLIIKDAIYAGENADDNKLDDAIEWLKYVNSKDKNNPYVILAKAKIFRTSGDNLSAEEQIKKILMNKKIDDRLYHQLGGYYFSDNKLDKTIEYTKLASELNKEDVQYLLDIGIIYRQLQIYDSSLIYLNKVIMKDPENLHAHIHRSNCYFKVDSLKKGCKDIERVKLIAPDTKIPDSLMNKCK
ncbi:MAG: hypothetical protein GY756_01450 [bacterium]|nr:hypothetical protein [bacterium]